MPQAARSQPPLAVELTWLLAGSRSRREEHAERIAALASEAPFEAVADEMDRHRSRLILGARARDLGLTPGWFDTTLDDLLRAAGLHAMLLDALTLQAVTRLEEAGIPVLPLKGTALAVAAHGDPSVRISEDIDLLVARPQLAAAVAVLATLGYTIDPREPRSAVHTVLRAPDPSMPRIEVHWRLHWYGDLFAARMLAQSRPGPDGARIARPCDTLAALLLFYAKDGFAGLRLAVDIAAFADRHAADLQVDEILEHGRRDPEISSALVTALAVARNVVGLDLAGQRPALSRREDRAARLTNWALAGDVDQTHATVRLVDALLAPPEVRSGFARERLRPFPQSGRNALYIVKTLLRWVPALASTRFGRVPHALPRLDPPAGVSGASEL